MFRKKQALVTIYSRRWPSRNCRLFWTRFLEVNSETACELFVLPSQQRAPSADRLAAAGMGETTVSPRPRMPGGSLCFMVLLRAAISVLARGNDGWRA